MACQQKCQARQEEALEEERGKSRVAIEAALTEERLSFGELVKELKVSIALVKGR